VKPPVFLTSTFVFRSAEEDATFSNLAAGRSEPEYGVDPGLVYSRFNHPNSEIVEDRLAIYEGARSAPSSRAAWRRSPRSARLLPAGRRHPAQPAALWRQRDADRPHLAAVRHRRGRLLGRHRRDRDSAKLPSVR